jgi:hypothetical protein
VLQRLADDAWCECAYIGFDIRQFWHRYQLARRSRTLANLGFAASNSWLVNLMHHARAKRDHRFHRGCPVNTFFDTFPAL